MDNKDMTTEEFEDLAFAHGADLASWPRNARSRATAFLAANPESETVLARAHSLDAALALARPADPVPSGDLLSRILADAATVRPDPALVAPTAPSQRETVLSRLRAFFSPAAACAASAMLGLWLGYAGPIDFTGAAVDVLGVETEAEFAFFDSSVASPMAGVIDVLEAE